MNLAGTDDLNFAPNEPSGTKISSGVSSSFNLAFVAFVRPRSPSARETRTNKPTPEPEKRDKTILVKRKSERERNIRVYCVCSGRRDLASPFQNASRRLQQCFASVCVSSCLRLRVAHGSKSKAICHSRCLHEQRRNGHGKILQTKKK